MPFVQIDLLEGRSPDQVAALIAETTAAVCRVLEVPEDRVRMVVREVPKTHWGIGGKTAKELGR
jgi:4-oxalocrotonate tautomerase